MTSILLALQTTEYILRLSNTTTKFIKTDEHSNMYVEIDGKKITFDQIPLDLIPLLYKLYDYEQSGLSPDQINRLVERWADV